MKKALVRAAATGAVPVSTQNSEPVRCVLLLSAVVLTVFSVTACLVDPDKPCGDELVETEDGFCECPEDSVLEGEVCRECGDHEVVRSGSCVCEQGYERSTSGGDCVMATPMSCGDGGCAEGGCDSSLQCSGGQLCDVNASMRCIEAPAGLGDDCSSSSDCEDTEATYCEVFASRTCQIEGCAEQGGRCPGDMVCCDYAIISRSLCIPVQELSAGTCPAPGVLVERQDEP